MGERRVVGSGDHEDVPGSPCASFPIKPHIDGIGLGFRLACDSAERVERGGSCLLDSLNVREARGFQIAPGFQSAPRGFRLVWEGK